MTTEFTRYSEYRGHQVLSIPGDVFDRSPRFVVQEHYVEAVPCAPHRSPWGARAEIDRCCRDDVCSVGRRQLDSATFGILPPQSRSAVVR